MMPDENHFTESFLKALTHTSDHGFNQGPFGRLAGFLKSPSLLVALDLVHSNLNIVQSRQLLGLALKGLTLKHSSAEKHNIQPIINWIRTLDEQLQQAAILAAKPCPTLWQSLPAP